VSDPATTAPTEPTAHRSNHDDYAQIEVCRSRPPRSAGHALGNPWIQPREHIGHWADLEAIPGNIGVLSSGERAYLLITASIGLGGTDGPAINLSDTISALDREQLTLVLAGIAHANGSHQSSGIEIDPITGTPSITRHASLYPWPE